MVNMRDDKCTTPRCRGTAEVEYLGKWLCGRCWDKQAEQPIIKQEQAEQETRPESKHLIYTQDLNTIEKATQRTIEQATRQANKV